MGRSGCSALVALLLTTAACDGDPATSRELGADGCPVVGYRGIAGATVEPAGELVHVREFADQIVSFRVVDERRGEPEGGPDAPYVPRWVTVRVDEIAWQSPEAPVSDLVPLGGEIEFLDWPKDPGDCIGITPTGNPTLVVGQTYAGALVVTGEPGLFPGSTGVVADDGSFGLRAEMLDGFVDAAAYGDAVAELAPVAAGR